MRRGHAPMRCGCAAGPRAARERPDGLRAIGPLVIAQLVIGVLAIGLLPACTRAPAPAPAAQPATQPQTAPAAAPAPPRVAPDTRRLHALIVGIDRYRYSDARQPGAVFSDLKGAVGDARRFRQALAEVYGVAVDTNAPGACESASAATTTLTDDCATRARILAALDARIAALKPGDTLLFYFAGHGSRYRDDEALDQDTGYNGTILPSDARNPDGSPGDIFDTELKQRKDRATAAGLYFVSVFDSCNSATATRAVSGGLSRGVPSLTGVRPPAPPAAPAPGPGGGYWAHLAAAQDGEQAQETGSGAVGKRAGVFTSALVDTLRLPGMRDATFGDLIGEVRLRVAAGGHMAQTPSAEGALTASFGARAGSTPLYAATVQAGVPVLQAGASSGITQGSRFALHASQADALARRAPLGTATVASVAGDTAALALDTAASDARPASLPARLVAEETAHFLPPGLLQVANDLAPGAGRDAADAALRATGYATVSATGGTRLVASAADPSAAALRADDGTLLAASLGRPGDPAFADRLDQELRKVARVQQLLALRTTGASGGGAADPFPVSLCVAADGYRPTACPALEAGGVRRLARGQRFTATVINRGARPAYLYVLAIDPFNAVDVVLPKPGEFDQPLAPNQPYRRARMRFDAAGPYRFVVLASARPVRADAFAQSGNGGRAVGGCTLPLERLLCAASAGTRDAGVAAVGDWSAQVSTVLVTPEDTAP